MPKTCIIGAGITGLASAWQLKQSGHQVRVLEAAPAVGGAMQSVQRDGYLAEEGPNSIQLGSADIETFLNRIPGLSEQIIEAEPAANKRYIVRSGTAQAVPMNPWQALTTPLWSLGAKLRVLKEPFIRARQDENEESVADFVRRRLGPELYNYAINPLVGGIYAGDPEKLSLRYGFPKLYALEQAHGGLIRGAFAKMKAARHAPDPRCASASSHSATALRASQRPSPANWETRCSAMYPLNQYNRVAQDGKSAGMNSRQTTSSNSSSPHPPTNCSACRSQRM